MTSTVEQTNLLLRPSSTGQHPSAETADWTGVWVCVGFAEQLTEVGAVLPATIGYHGAHVLRTADGLIAAINARPFGGCMSIPVHCGSTQNVRCPQVACAFSEDGGVLDGATDPTGAARVGFLGDGRRPPARVPLAQHGPLLFLNITMGEPPPLPIARESALDDLQVVTTGQRLVSGNWLSTPPRAAATIAAATSGAQVTTVAPNLALIRHGSDTVAIVSRPAGHTRSTLVWALLSPAGAGSSVDPQLIERVPFSSNVFTDAVMIS